jgi:hypothetical protein
LCSLMLTILHDTTHTPDRLPVQAEAPARHYIL